MPTVGPPLLADDLKLPQSPRHRPDPPPPLKRQDLGLSSKPCRWVFAASCRWFVTGDRKTNDY
ncbi:MAG: hypothetical protein SFV23_22385, partial [Planctomycetaceae bacterium]|nr:hypothetical protein [Planctomycetaceae bacterium]